MPFISSDIYCVLRYTRTIWRLNVVRSLNICPWFKRQEELKGQSTAANQGSFFLVSGDIFVLKLRFRRSAALKISKSSYDLQSARIIIAAWSSFTIVGCCECSVKKWPIVVIVRFLYRTFSLVRFIGETFNCIFFYNIEHSS